MKCQRIVFYNIFTLNIINMFLYIDKCDKKNHIVGLIIALNGEISGFLSIIRNELRHHIQFELIIYYLIMEGKEVDIFMK